MPAKNLPHNLVYRPSVAENIGNSKAVNDPAMKRYGLTAMAQALLDAKERANS
jgi:hypothetical protein